MILSRSTLTPCEQFLAWSSQPTLTTPWTLGVSGPFVPTCTIAQRRGYGWIQSYVAGLVCPQVEPGEYELWNGGIATGLRVTVRVPEPPKTPPHVYNPGAFIAPVDSIERSLLRADVILLPGRYKITRPIRLQSNRTIFADGAILERQWDNSYANHIFQPAPFCSIIGAIIEWGPAPYGSDPNRMVFANLLPDQPPVSNVTLRRVTLRGGNLGEWDRPGFLAADCLFDHASSGPVTGPCMFLRCRFQGLSEGNSFVSWGARGVALVDCDFDGTDRGPVFQCNRSDVRDCLITGTVMRGIDHVHNGCEGVSFEGADTSPYAFVSNMIFGTHYQGSGYGLNIGRSAAYNCLFRDFTLRNGLGIQMGSRDDDPFELNTTFQDGEIVGGGFTNVGAGGFNVVNVSCINPQPTRGHLFGELIYPEIKDYSGQGQLDGVKIVMRPLPSQLLMRP